ncbi:tyrosine-type recombinase/integrase [Arachidicoccus soli]|nr:site-specific integrase [Arachidicoccus soli]
MTTSVKLYLDTKRIKKNGKYPVKVMVIWNRKFNLYPTGIDLTEQEFSKVHLDKKLRKEFGTISYFLEKADKIANGLEHDFNWLGFKQSYYNNQPEILQGSNNMVSLNIFDHIKEYVDLLHSEGRISTKSTYILTSTYLNKYLGSPKKPVLLFRTIDKLFLNKLEEFLLNTEGLSYSSIGIYMRNIRAIFNLVIDQKKIISRDLYPFGKHGYTPPSTKNTKKALSLTEVGQIYNHKSAVEFSTEAWARDMWLFAYFCNGLNVKDIAHLKYENYDVENNILSFYRAKSRNATKDKLKKIEVFVINDAKGIIEKWGQRPVEKSNFIFNILEKELTAEEEYKREKNAIKTINKYMGKIGIELKLKRKPTTNFARHTFSTVLIRSGEVPIELISEQLGHSNIRTTQLYLDSFEKEQKSKISKHLTAFKPKKENSQQAKNTAPNS